MITYITCAAAAIMLAAGCSYPFVADVNPSDKRLVIEGDILIGEKSFITLSYLSDIYESSSIPVNDAEVWVESNDGFLLRGVYDTDASAFVLDMIAANASSEYKLHVLNHDNGHEYATDWSSVCQPPVIDELSYIPKPEKDQMNIALSIHSSGNSHFRWTYTEHWEYHAEYFASCYYVTPKMSGKTYGEVRNYLHGENTYYCWDSEESSEIMIFSTEGQTEDRFVDLEFHSIPRTSKKLQILYYIEVKLEAISDTCYKYWNNVQQNSDYQGSLFAPSPSEMSGNIKCLTDENERVIGYINFAQRASKNLFIDNSITHFYQDKEKHYSAPEIITKEKWYSYYWSGWIPVYADPDQDPDTPIYYWVEDYCADCRKGSGNKNKPIFWPRPEI